MFFIVFPDQVAQVETGHVKERIAIGLWHPPFFGSLQETLALPDLSDESDLSYQ